MMGKIRNYKFKNTLKMKMMIFSVLLLLSLLICQIFFNVFLSKKYFIKEKKSEITTLYKNIKDGYSENPEDIYEITKKAEEVDNIKIIISSHNNIIYSNKNVGRNKFMDTREPQFLFDIKMNNYSLNPEVETVDEGHNDSNNTFLRLAGKFYLNNETVDVLIFSRVESIDNAVSLFSKISTIIAVIILIVGLGASYIFAANLSKPINEIEQVADNVSHLNFDCYADENNINTYEIKSLAKSINTMSHKLNTTINDLTDANDKLQQDIDLKIETEAMRKEFIASVSHEMKTPLCLLLMYSEMLKDNSDSIDKDYYLNTIIEETNKLNDMLKKLLDISAIENGLTKMNFVKTNLSDLCSDTMSKLNILLSDFIVSVDIEDNIIINCDNNYIEQCIKNYVTNAVSYGTKGGNIRISLKKDKNHALFSVYNDGKQINEKELELLWHSFYRHDKARTRDEDNHLGLGLYIVKTVIQSHTGLCHVQNQDNGVCFSFTLPLMC